MDRPSSRHFGSVCVCVCVCVCDSFLFFFPLSDLVLQFILDGLRVVAIATLAAKAVQSVCQKCRHRMAPHFRSLVQVGLCVCVCVPHECSPADHRGSRDTWAFQ